MEAFILEAPRTKHNLSVTLLSGGVGGARMARGLGAVLAPESLTVVVNVGDDDDIHGVRVCADLDTVTFTMAGVEGPHGWGIDGDTFTVMDHLERLGADVTFRLGDRDLATCMRRTTMLGWGVPLSTVTAAMTSRLGVAHRILPATDGALRTRITTRSGESLSFQEYFVVRRHRDAVADVTFVGAADAKPAPGVVEAIEGADVLVIAPSNPVLSIWPTLAVPGVRECVAAHPLTVAVSPLFGGHPVKGPADRLLAAMALPAGNAGVVAAYEGLIQELVVDIGDAADAALSTPALRVRAVDTRIGSPEAGARLAGWLLDHVG
jgi:LPPG:FO 2-phospho-L-lactate transferase